MNEQALKDAYEAFVSQGYSKSIDEFKKLINTNPDALKDSYDVFVSEGYTKSIDDYKNLLGVGQQAKGGEVKKKFGLESSSEVGSSELPKSPDGKKPFSLPKISPEDMREQPNVVSRDATFVKMPRIDITREQGDKKRKQKADYELKTAKELNALQIEDKKKQLEEQKEAEKLNLGLRTRPDFTTTLNSVVNSNFTAKAEEDVVEDLRKNFSKYGLVFEEYMPGKDAVLVRTNDGKKSTIIYFNNENQSGNVDAANKLKDFISKNSIEVGGAQSGDILSNSLKAQKLRNVGRLNPDGSTSTVKFTSFEEDGKFKVIPTLFPKDPNNYSTNPNTWTELQFKDALKLARERGEVFEFKTDKEAKQFAKGAWKDVSPVDIEGEEFYKKRNIDYMSNKKMYDEYVKVRDMVSFIEESKDAKGFKGDLIMNPESKKYPNLIVGGKFRKDIDKLLESYKKQEDQLRSQVFDSEFMSEGKIQKTREEFDEYLDKRQNKVAQEAAKLNTKAKTQAANAETESINLFGLSVKDLIKYKPKDDQEAQEKNRIVEIYEDSKVTQSYAAKKYENAKTYFDAKVNKQIKGEYEDNWSAFSNSVSDAYSNGKAAEQILGFTLGLKDINSKTDKVEAARIIVENLTNQSKNTSRVMSRWQQASGFSESLDAFLDNPLELSLTMAATSLSQILPYGMKIVPTTTAVGAGTGALAGLIGGPFAPATSTAGAVTGGVQGFRTGMAATSLAMEYTNSVLDVMREKGYDINDPKQVEEALSNDEVWAEGGERGLKRGIPIAVVDYLSAGLAGKVFKPASVLASTGTKVAAQVGERAVFDPFAEATGELAAQVSAGQEIDWKEISAEAMGGLGNNSSNMAINTYRTVKNNTDINIANNLTDINFVGTESASDQRISSWANNMQQLGKIDADVNQRIQENVGLRRDAREALSVGTESSKIKPNVMARTMELMSAKEELSSSANRRELYSDKIKEIKEELKVIADTKELAPKEQSVDLGLTIGATRKEVGQYMIDGIRYTKEQFLEKTKNMSARRILRSAISVKNDEETGNELQNIVKETLKSQLSPEELVQLQQDEETDKLFNILNQTQDAVQEQSTTEIPVQSETGISETVAEGISQPKPEVVTEQVTQEEIDNRPISERQAEAESKIKRKDLFTGVGEFSTKLGNSDKAAVPVSHNENNGIEIVEYAHPDTGSVDVIVTGKTNNDFVGFYRIYENGKPTNKWSSKFENQSRNKEDFKTMISGVQELLPEGHQYTEKTSISTDGLRVWEQQLNKGYQTQTDENGNIITDRVAINGDAISNILGIDVNKGNFENIKATKEEFENIKEVLTPYMEKLGLSSENIYFVSGGPAPGAKGSVKIDLPVLKKSDEVTQPQTIIEEQVTEPQVVSEVNVSQELNEEALPGYDRMMGEVEGIVGKSKQRKANEVKTAENVMSYVMGSKVYEDATDVQREALVRDVRKRFGLKEKSAPSVAKLFGKLKDVRKVIMTEKAALEKQIKDQAKGGVYAARAIKEATKSLIQEVKDLRKTGKINKIQEQSILNRLSNTNVLSEKSTKKFIDYATKVYNDADYANKISEAKGLRSSIKKLSKDKEKNANLRVVAFQFAKIDPSLVEDIDMYNEMASKIKEAVKGSTIRLQKVKFAETVNIQEAASYTSDRLAEQEQKIREEMIAELQDLMGVDASEFTAEEMLALLEPEAKTDEYNEGIVRATIKKAFDIYSAMISESIKSGKDVFTDEDVEYTKNQKELISKFMNMDTDKMNIKDSLAAVDSLMNFLTNQSTAKMEAVFRKYEGKQNAENIRKEKIFAVPLKKLGSTRFGRALGEQTTNLNILFEKMFVGFNRSAKVRDAMGLTDLVNGKSKAQRQSNDIVANYVAEFYNKEANNQKFNTLFNNVERGMTAFVSRNIVGTEAEMQAEFDRRKKLVEESINVLLEGNQEERQKGLAYQKVYDKVLDGSTNIQEIQSKVDPTNLKAVDFWIKEWDNQYEQLSDTALNIYNKVLDKDLNYTPDRFTRTNYDGSNVDLANTESAFISNTDGSLYKKETGVLMSATRPQQLPKNNDTKEVESYIDLSFDKNNSNSMYDALVDINTAGPIRQVESFMNTADFRKIFGEDADLIRGKKGNIGRVQQYIQNIRNKNPFSNDEFSKTMRSLNKIATLGVSQALAGPTQPLKQVAPVILNTLINTGGTMDFSAMRDKNFMSWLNESGYAIASRGIESQSEINSINQLIEQAAESKGAKAVKFIEDANKKLLKTFLVKPDVWVAINSWKSYYEQSLRDQGIDAKGIDYSDHKINKKAADYAQSMVDRQQNVSDADMSGALFSNRNAFAQTMVKIFMPFASFRMNQASRLGSDLRVLTNRDVSTAEDRKIAARSLAGYAVEMAAFRTLSASIAIGLASATASLMGKGETEDDKKKRRDNLIKGAATSTLTDIVSPIPVLDKLVQNGAASLLETVQNGLDISEKDRVSLYSEKKQNFIEGLGTFGIAFKRGEDLWKMLELSVMGKYKDDFGKERVISVKDKNAIAKIFPFVFVSNLTGLASPEISTVGRNAVKIAKKKGLTPEEQLEAFEETERILKMIDDANTPEEKQAAEEMLIRMEDPESFESEKEYIKSLREIGLTDDKTGITYDNLKDLKRYNPELYDKNFGPDSEYYKLTIDDKEAKKELNELEQEAKDKEFNYTPDFKIKKNKDGSKKRGSYSYKYKRTSSDGSTTTITKNVD